MTFRPKFPEVQPDPKYGQLVSNFFWHQLDRFARNTLFVDFESGREWRGDKIKATSQAIAQNLIRHGMGAHSSSVMFYKHNDWIQLAALGCLFAGSSVCVGYDADPEHEHAHMLKLVKPQFVFVRHELVAEMMRHCAELDHFEPKRVIVMDDNEIPAALLRSLEGYSRDNSTQVIGLHKHLLQEEPQSNKGHEQHVELPVQVSPNWPAFILLTSGSTGRPKPAGRSQRNSLYVAHSLVGADELWQLDESSVLSGHLALDHGTGIFQLKQCLARGFKTILMNGYDLETLVEAIRKYKISDIVLGSALLHKFLDSTRVAHLLGEQVELFGSLRNFIAVGSSIASQSVVRDFMARLPECSVRQAFGMTECGFLCIVPREWALACARGEAEPDPRVVGFAMPNVELKLMDDQGREIEEPNRTGEIYVRAPTISPGYHGEEYAEQSRELFLQDGFYRSGDVCSFTPEGALRIHGRKSEVLCLYDGWKVLPVEIEQVLLEHPLVGEAAVIGIPHPELPTCHAPRAYVVPREGVAVTEDDEIEAHTRELNGTSNGKTNGKSNGTAHGRDEQKSNQAELQNGQKGESSLKEEPMQRLSRSQIFDFVAKRLSEPKHLVGGIVFMRELPKISIGKVDRKSLRRMEGLVK